MITFEILIQSIENRLHELLAQDESSVLVTAGRYSLFTAGKRLRPLLALTSCLALGGDMEKALDPACCIELIHTYSLIHDDLPCMDNDDFRRGKPSLHKVYPEGQALLTGNFLFTYALEIITKSQFLDPHKKLDLIALFAKRTGLKGMMGGQSEDLLLESQTKVLFYQLRQLHRKKTASLIAAALETAGIITEATQKEKRLLTKLGFTLGLAFQAVDDMNDQKQKNEQAKNMAIQLGIARLKTYIEMLKTQISKYLEQLAPRSELLKKLITTMLIPSSSY